jgi:hypothetical protein
MLSVEVVLPHLKGLHEMPFLDPEGITEESARERALHRSLYSLHGYPTEVHLDGTILNEEIIAVEIADSILSLNIEEHYKNFPPEQGPVKRFRSLIRRMKESKKPSSSRKPGQHYYKFAPNMAFMLESLIFTKTLLYKKRWVKRCERTGIEFPSETLTVWFIEYLLDYAISDCASVAYLAVALLKVLFYYNFQEFAQVAAAFEYFPHSDEVRRRKLDIMQELEKGFGSLLQRETGARNEEHFVRAINPDEHIELIEECLRMMRPMLPVCIHPVKFQPDSFDLSVVLDAYTGLNSTHSTERKKVKAMSSPEILSPILKLAGLPDWRARLALPHFFSNKMSVGQGPTLGGRRTIARGNEELTEKLKDHLRQRDIRRGEMTFDNLSVVVEGFERRTFSLDKSRPMKFRLTPDERIIELRGRDEKGTLPLSTHCIIWNSALIEDRVYKYVTKLRNRRRVEFLIRYEKDKVGELTGAQVEVNYLQPLAMLSPEWVYEKLSASPWTTVGATLGMIAFFLFCKSLSTEASGTGKYTKKRKLSIVRISALLAIVCCLCLLIHRYVDRVYTAVVNTVGTVGAKNSSVPKETIASGSASQVNKVHAAKSSLRLDPVSLNPKEIAQTPRGQSVVPVNASRKAKSLHAHTFNAGTGRSDVAPISGSIAVATSRGHKMSERPIATLDPQLVPIYVNVYVKDDKILEIAWLHDLVAALGRTGHFTVRTDEQGEYVLKDIYEVNVFYIQRERSTGTVFAQLYNPESKPILRCLKGYSEYPKPKMMAATSEEIVSQILTAFQKDISRTAVTGAVNHHHRVPAADPASCLVSASLRYDLARGR